MPSTLHYIFDPLCGWCYAAQPMLRAVRDTLGPRLALQLHPGLLFEQPKTLDAGWRGHIVDADQRIAQLAGVRFGEAYIARLRSHDDMVLDSNLPARAVMAAEQCRDGAGLVMLEAIQHAHYVAGQDVTQADRLLALAGEGGLDSKAFSAALTAQASQMPTAVHQARTLLEASGGRGFPTFILEHEQRLMRLDHARVYGQPAAFAAQIHQLIDGEPA
ncbi:MAG: DsbA family protein [Rhodocyclaceae bacterium]